MRIGMMVAIALLVGGPAVAHEFWIEPKKDRYAPGETVTADLKVGLNLLGEPYPYLSNRFDSFTAAGEAVIGAEGDLPALSFAPGAPGLLVVAHQTVAFRTEHDDWQVFLDYLAMEGLQDAEAEHRRRGLPQTGFVERYTRHARALIQVGAPGPDDTDTPSGLPFELIAEGSPFLPGADTLTVMLTRNGQPVVDQQITVYARHDRVARSVVHTDEAGRATIALNGGGTYLLNAVVLEAVEGAGPVAWESHWASLTFRLPPARLHRGSRADLEP